jgi:hypothetical protein
MRRAGRVCAACAVALGLAACESTEDAAKKISAKGQAAFNAKGLDVTQTDKSLQVLGTTVLTDSNGTAVIVEIKNKGPAMFDLPISINVTDSGGHSVFKNDAAGLEKDLANIPLIQPSQVFDWVNDQVLANGTPAKVTAKIAAGKPAPKPLPSIQLGPVSLQTDPTSGVNASGKVTNKSNVTQNHLVLFAVAKKGNKVVAAGRAIIMRLLPGKTAPFHAYFIGNPAGAQLSVVVPPSCYAQEPKSCPRPQ